MPSRNRLLVDQNNLVRILEWGRALGVPCLREDHARDGLFVGEGYLAYERRSDKEKQFLMGLDVTFWFWIDDRVDQNLERPEPLVDWDRLLGSLKGELPADATIESRFLNGIRGELANVARSTSDVDWWVITAIRSLEGFQREEVLTRSRRTPSLVEYIETGGWSMPMPNIVATGSILLDLEMAKRRFDPAIADLDRLLSAYTRLENDLQGIEKERLEKSPSNAVLLMEKYMPTDIAKSFVQELKRGYASMVFQGVDALGANDPLGRFMRATMAAHEKWYGGNPERYKQG